MKIGSKLTIPQDLTIDPYNKRGQEGKLISKELGIFTIQFSDGTTGKYFPNVWQKFAKGGKVNENAEMVLNQNTQIKHHTEELKSIVKTGVEVPAWVVAKINRSANDISDATHYLDGETKMAKGGYLEYQGTLTDDALKFILSNDFPNENYEVNYNDLNGNMVFGQRSILQKIRKTLLNEYGIKSEINDIEKFGMPYLSVPNQTIDKMAKGGKLNYPDYYSDGGNVSDKINHLKGHYVDYYFMGVPNPSTQVIKSVEVSPASFSNRVVKIHTTNGTTDILPFDKLDDFINGEEVKIKADNGEAYVITFMKKMAKGGIVKYYTKDDSYRLSRPSGSIEKDILERVTFKNSVSEEHFVGNFGWKTPQGKLGDGYLYKLDDYDQNLIKDLKLKSGEKVFRYFNRLSAIGGMTPLIKLNLEKGLIYFLKDNDNDDIIFETRGTNALWISLIEDKMSKGGKVEKVMNEFKKGKLHSGSKKGPIVKSKKQAIAIALSEERDYKKGWSHKSKGK
jgi:hypothetical protein